MVEILPVMCETIDSIPRIKKERRARRGGWGDMTLFPAARRLEGGSQQAGAKGMAAGCKVPLVSPGPPFLR